MDACLDDRFVAAMHPRRNADAVRRVRRVAAAARSDVRPRPAPGRCTGRESRRNTRPSATDSGGANTGRWPTAWRPLLTEWCPPRRQQLRPPHPFSVFWLPDTRGDPGQPSFTSSSSRWLSLMNCYSRSSSGSSTHRFRLPRQMHHYGYDRVVMHVAVVHFFVVNIFVVHFVVVPIR